MKMSNEMEAENVKFEQFTRKYWPLTDLKFIHFKFHTEEIKIKLEVLSIHNVEFYT